MKDASFQGNIYAVIATAEREAFLLGFREHREGTPCPARAASPPLVSLTHKDRT